MNYILANPTGNITALVTSEVAASERQNVVKEIFETEPSCEQVGFVDVTGRTTIKLEMMGGEFCGNATLCAAAYLAKTNELFDAEHNDDLLGARDDEKVEISVTVDSSGADKPVEVKLTQIAEDCYEGTLEMPMPVMEDTVVHLDGISHMIIPADEISREEAEASVKGYAEDFNALAFGEILYSDDNENAVSIEPLVYVKGSDTMVWENGCASGSIAAACYKHWTSGATQINVFNPGGIIKINIEEEKLYLTGGIQL